ncbi:MAG: transposase [Phycisphaerales bacterium]|nr:MAG: transposase [Phycisphaerales bacterium]
MTSDVGLLPLRELGETFRLTETASVVSSDRPPRKNTQHTMMAMFRQAIYGGLTEYADVNDAERPCVDPAIRRIVGGRAKE